jgi:RHS repeat-associated protein
MDDNATLDKLGNWTQFNNNGDVQDRSHNAVNEITSITPDQALTYDENGNMTFHKDKNYVWDANNRLTHVYNMSEPGQVARYYYSAMNQRVMKHFDSDDDGLLDEKTVYIYCHQKVCEEQDENGNFKRDYIHGGQFIDEVVMTSDVANAMGSFSLTDLRYSVYAVVDASGAVVERYQYDPYGSRTVLTPSFVSISESAIGQEFGYTGRRHDAEDTGLIYFRARYYSGELGRFVSRDPLGTALDVDWMNYLQ